MWDPYDEKWYESACWHCLEIEVLKGNKILRAFQPWDTDMVDRFLEIAMDDRMILDKVTMIKFGK